TSNSLCQIQSSLFKRNELQLSCSSFANFFHNLFAKSQSIEQLS
ncbi:unnamed protein product, partial [Cylindrotheca closterium]